MDDSLLLRIADVDRRSIDQGEPYGTVGPRKSRSVVAVCSTCDFQVFLGTMLRLLFLCLLLFTLL